MLSGFASQSRDTVLGVGQFETVDVTLGVASLQEAVTVMAESNVIDTTSAKIGVNVSPEEVENLPVNGRNFANLMTLATGATSDGNGGWASVRFNGKSNQQNYLNYDGVDGTYVWDASPGYLNATGSQFRLQTSMESIAEFRVNSGLAPAESGLGAGGNITVDQQERQQPVQRSVFNYFRNDALDSASKYDDKKQPLEFNQFGGSLGGPIVVEQDVLLRQLRGPEADDRIELHRSRAERRGDSPDSGWRAGRQRRRPEPGAHAGDRAAAGRIPAAARRRRRIRCSRWRRWTPRPSRARTRVSLRARSSLHEQPERSTCGISTATATSTRRIAR